MNAVARPGSFMDKFWRDVDDYFLPCRYPLPKTREEALADTALSVNKGSVVYVAGPLTTGNVIGNVREACLAAQRLKNAGYYPIVPHVMIAMELATGDSSYEGWLEWCKAILERCDALVRLPGYSSGADREVAWAEEMGLTVTTVDELVGPTQSKN